MPLRARSTALCLANQSGFLKHGCIYQRDIRSLSSALCAHFQQGCNVIPSTLNEIYAFIALLVLAPPL